MTTALWITLGVYLTLAIPVFITLMELGGKQEDAPKRNEGRSSYQRRRFELIEVWTGTLLWPLYLPLLFAWILKTYPKLMKKLAFMTRDTLDD